MIDIKINWVEFDNFFSLWEHHKKSTQLIYVIGESHHCYIGCVGINGGKGGLGQRYQRQYVYRSLAIFATEESKGQKSFAGSFVIPDNITKYIIGAAEALVQESFVNMFSVGDALFSPETVPSGYKIEHEGKIPIFLKTG